MPPRSHNPKREELYHIAGDAPDPMGGDLRGHQATVNLKQSAQGRVLVRFEDLVLEVDVYALPGQPIWLHLICPRCRNSLKISEDRKAIEWSPPRPGSESPDGGELSVAAFECTWEIDVADRKQRDTFINNLCRLKLVIDKNIARKA